MIKNIIFDLAGVIFNLDIKRDTEALVSIGLPDFEGCLKHPDIVGPTLSYLNGLSPAEELCNKIRRFCNPGITDEEIIDAMDAVLDDIPSSRLSLLVQLRKHYRVFLLSNLYDRAWKRTVKIFENYGYHLEDCFEQTFLSCELQLAKPDPRIFQHVFKVTGIDPAETLYLDDTRENIDAGLALGLDARLVPMNQIETLLPSLGLNTD